MNPPLPMGEGRGEGASSKGHRSSPTPLRHLPDPPTEPALAALWHAARNDWHQAHEAAQSDDSPEAAWVHAHLHRVEGDIPNARYWYARAGRPEAQGPLDAEWQSIAEALASRPTPA